MSTAWDDLEASQVIAEAALQLANRWALTRDVARVALYDMAAELGVRVIDLAALVVLGPNDGEP